MVTLQVGPDGEALLTADDNTWSSATDRPGGLVLAAGNSLGGWWGARAAVRGIRAAVLGLIGTAVLFFMESSLLTGLPDGPVWKHGAPQAVFRAVKLLFLVAVFPRPLALLAAGLASDSHVLLAIAFLVQYAGLLAERWFFFAEANHPQNLYYQTV